MPKPDFSGTWTFNRARSVLQIPPPNFSTFVVTHNEPDFRLSRTHVYNETSDTFTLDLVADGREIACTRGALNALCRAYWKGDVLTFDSQLVNGTKRATNTVRYRLADDHTTIVAEEEFRSQSLNYDNVWVLGRH